MDVRLLSEKASFSLVAGLSVCLLAASSLVGLKAQNNTSQTTVSPDNPVVGTAELDSAANINSMAELNNERKLEPGDRVSYRVIEEQKDPASLVVTDSGELPVPIIGLFPASGKTCKQLAEQLKPLLEKDYFYHATVIVGLDTESTRSLGKVYLTGQVHSQGSMDLPANQHMTVSEAIMANGGFADFANQRRVNLIRRKPDGTAEKFVIDVKAILTKGQAAKDMELQPDDTIQVPEKLINF